VRCDRLGEHFGNIDHRSHHPPPETYLETALPTQGRVDDDKPSLELAAWSTDGAKLWTTFVEPPWSHVTAGQVVLDVMGAVRTFNLRSGP
jgi:hypothetical protein